MVIYNIMRKIAFILLFTSITIVLFGFCNIGHNNTIVITNQQKVDTNKIIFNIREEFKIINSDTTYIVVEKDLSGFSTEGGVLFSFYDKSTLKKSIITFYGEMSKRIDEYYFKNGKLIFVFKQNFYYDKPIYMNGFKVDYIEENRYYFYENKLIKWIDDKKVERNVNEKSNKNIANKLVNDAIAILNLKKDKSYSFTSCGNYEYELFLSFIIQKINLTYNFYKEPDQLIIEDQKGNIVFKTKMTSTSGEQVKEINLSNRRDIEKLIFKIKTKKTNSKWMFKIEIK